MSTPLRRMLAEGVAARRADDAARAASVPAGAFDVLRPFDFIHFATIGRRTGQRRQKYWGVYGIWGDAMYLVEEVGTDVHWVRNVMADPRVEVWAPGGAPRVQATARVVTAPAEADLGRQVVVARIPGEQWVLTSGLVLVFDAG